MTLYGVSTVRALIGIVATVTMVIHFTVGCCTHVLHDAEHVCSSHDHHAAHGHADEDTQEACEVEPIAIVSQQAHDCDGCRCVATRSASVTLPILCELRAHVICIIPAQLSWSSAVLARTPDPFVYSGLRPHCVFERFLI